MSEEDLNVHELGTGLEALSRSGGDRLPGQTDLRMNPFALLQEGDHQEIQQGTMRESGVHRRLRRFRVSQEGITEPAGQCARRPIAGACAYTPGGRADLRRRFITATSMKNRPDDGDVQQEVQQSLSGDGSGGVRTRPASGQDVLACNVTEAPEGG